MIGKHIFERNSAKRRLLLSSLILTILCIIALNPAFAASSVEGTLRTSPGFVAAQSLDKCRVANVLKMSNGQAVPDAAEQPKAESRGSIIDTLRSPAIRKDSAELNIKNVPRKKVQKPLPSVPGFNYLLPGADALPLPDAPSLPFY